MAKGKAIKEKKIFPSSATNDSFQNFATKLGVGRGPGGQPSNALSYGAYVLNLITRNRLLLESAYRGSWVVGVMIDAMADDMTKSGIELTTSEAKDNEILKIKSAMSRLMIWQSINGVIKWADLYGGAIGLLDIEGQDRATPLDPETISKGQFNGIIVYDRWQLTPDLVNVIKNGPMMGLPEFYTITSNNDPSSTSQEVVSGGVRVHYTRCIRMEGIHLPYFQAITENMWGESVLERMYDRLISFDTTTMATANLVFKASLRTVKIDGYREIVAAGGDALDGLIAQFESMRQLQTSDGLSLLDKEDEFNVDSYTFAGLDAVLLQFAQQLAGASEIPLVRLFGQSPAGLGATGDSDLRMYYDKINSKQESKLRNPMQLILTVMWRSEFGKAIPDDLQFTFKPLYQMNAVEKSQVAKTNAETITGAFEAGLTSKQTAMKELKQSADDTGIFGNITEDDINDAEDDEDPPMPSENEPNPQGEEMPESQPPTKKPTGDSFIKRLFRGNKNGKSL